MRNIPDDLVNHLKSGATTLCRCWKLTRSDMVEMGFTDHDCTLDFDGVSYEPSTGLDAVALESSTGLAVDNTQALGALTAAGLCESDIEAGVYDGASIVQYLVNWQDPSVRVVLFKGTIGEIKRGSGLFEAELRSISESLNQPVGRAYLRQCDAQLGDEKCTKKLTSSEFTAEVDVVETLGQRVLHLNNLGEYDDGWFTHGQVKFLTGENQNITRTIKVDMKNGAERIIEVWEDFLKPLTVGDRVIISAGCDKIHQTCRTKFSNLLNFQGFPHMPGDDWALSYPIRDGQNDGGSLGS